MSIGEASRPQRTDEPADRDTAARVTCWVRGQVQGVGFRWWTRSRALELGLVGSAANLSDGRVEVIAEGTRGNCERLVQLLDGGRTPGSVDGVSVRFDAPRGGLNGFVEH